MAFSLLAGCAATPPVLTADNPASPQAPEAKFTSLAPLKRDAITQRTLQMLAQAAKQQEEWDKNGPMSGGQQGQQMQGMQMPQEQTQPSPTPNN
jgi:hypothetical protein